MELTDSTDHCARLRVLLVTDTDKPLGELRDALARIGYEMLDEVATPARLPAAIEKERPDVVIIDTESPSRDTLEQLAVMHATAPRPVLMFSHDADQQLIRAAVGAGVSAYLVEGLSAERLAPILEVALARFSHDARLRQRLTEVERELADRKLIDRAKRMLMEHRRLSEQQAYATLRRSAMNQGIRIVDAARLLLADHPPS
ncbi:ANTAR domain-containing response regulator [Burkholderia singularis]|uniref:Response regulator NasT n=1 Tax=Burkholderia singularis TaxID=1503053 RepID=A0A238H6V4_9BURK|nr:ANTAR domain-containing protein [Burkholderia singularis]SMG00825.1 Response regulator NasT [Burkholderia singularis]